LCLFIRRVLLNAEKTSLRLHNASGELSPSFVKPPLMLVFGNASLLHKRRDNSREDFLTIAARRLGNGIGNVLSCIGQKPTL